MSADRSSGTSRLRYVPLDLVVVIGVTILVNVAVFAPVVRSTSLRVPLGVLFVFFVPGYVLVATLFPEAGRSSRGADPSEHDSPSLVPRAGIDGLERIVLSFGASVTVVPGVALLLNYTPWGISPVSVLVASTIVTLVLTGTAVLRRQRLSETERFRVPVRRTVAELWDDAGDRAEMLLTALLVASVVLAAGSVAYAITTPADGEQFSEIYLLGEDEDGELVADEYPTDFDAGESRELVVGIENNEHRPAEYTVVAVEQAVEPRDDGHEVAEQRELDRLETQLDHGESWEREHELEPTIEDEHVRIVWLVYLDGEVPNEPSTENAAYHVHLWVDVTNDDS